MSLRQALQTLDDRYRGERAVWLVGLVFGLVLATGYALLFVVDSPVTTAAGYAVFVLLVAPLFGAALWPYARGDPPESTEGLVRESLRRYPRLLAVRVGYVLLLVGSAVALLSVVLALATLVSLGTSLAGGGATTLSPREAIDVAGFTGLGLTVVGLAVGRVLFGFLDVATLRRGRLEGALSEALSTVLAAPGRVLAAAAGLAVYRAVLPLVAYGVVAANVDTREFVETPFRSPELAVLPADAPSYASPPDPALAPEILAALVAADVFVTAVVWPVALGYHVALFETLRSTDGEVTGNEASAGVPDPQ